MLDSWERGSTMTMKKFDGYHLGWDDQAIDEVRFVFTNEEGAVKALAASGTLSMSSDDQTQETYDAIDSMIDEARSTGDVAAQNEIYKAMQRKLVDQQSDVYLLTQTSQQAFSECIDGFTWVPMQSFEFNFHTMKWVCE